jgi:ATP-dependent RNA helicase DeaD
MVWFRLSVGRSANADPKWLIPLICRRGHVTKKDIGSIRIFDRETKFEITRDAVDRFNAALASGPPQPIRIEAAGAPSAPGPRRDDGDSPRPPRKPFKKKPSNAGR